MVFTLINFFEVVIAYAIIYILLDPQMWPAAGRGQF
jgi:hypothetical protein